MNYHFPISKKNKKRNKFGRFWLIALFAIMILPIATLILKFSQDKNQVKTVTEPANPAIENTTTPKPEQTEKKIKTFELVEFKNLYDTIKYPNTEQINLPPTITGNELVDSRITKLAEAKGYKLRSVARGNIKDVNNFVKLQPLAVKPFLDLVDSAKNAKLDLRITASFRSISDQRDIFLEQLNKLAVNQADIPKGNHDDQINRLLERVAPPGYSRHHTGFTVDFQCGEQALYSFEKSPCYEWMANNNYYLMKNLGWIPSYPKGVTLMGPEPEPWEYTWVGREALLE